MQKEDICKIVKASGVSAGERVLVHFWGEDADKSIANYFVAAVASMGATPALLQQSRSVNYDLFRNAKESCFDDTYFDAFSRFDAVLDVFAYQPIVLGHKLEPSQMALYRRYISNLFNALMKAKRFTQIRIPTEANAAESNLAPAEYIHRMEQAYHIDYDALFSACVSLQTSMAQSDRYILQTGVDCELVFDLTGRSWHIDAGDGDWPCGEIYIAPNEAKTNGTVFFKELFLDDIGNFQNVTLTIIDGRLTRCDNDAINEYIANLTPENTVICELGFGLNPNVTDLCGYTVLDEKMAGSFHIAIGANQMFGGKNEASTHIDLVNSGHYVLLPKK